MSGAKSDSFEHPPQCRCSLRLGYFEMEVFTYSLSIIYQRGEADVFSMIFNPGDGGFLGTQFIRHLFLGKACFKTSLLQENTNFELLISFVKIFCKFWDQLLSCFLSYIDMTLFFIKK